MKKIIKEIIDKIKGTDRRTLLVIAVLGFVGMAVATVGGYKLSNHPEFCRTCHIMDPYVDAIQASAHGGQECGICHYEPGFFNGLRDKAVFGTASMMAQVTGHRAEAIVVAMVDSSCLRGGCHDRERLKEEKILYKKGIVFSHAGHFEAGLGEKGVKCVACHTQVKADNHMEVLPGVCIQCHMTERKDQEVLACDKCHSLPALYSTEDQNHIEVMADEDTACDDCHDMEPVKSNVEEKECLKCHKEEPKKKGDYGVAEIHDAHMGYRTVYCAECHSPIAHKMEK